MPPAVLTRSDASAVLAVVASLPAPERDVIEAVDVRGASHFDAADALGMPLGVVRRRLFTGRRHVVRALAG